MLLIDLTFCCFKILKGSNQRLLIAEQIVKVQKYKNIVSFFMKNNHSLPNSTVVFTLHLRPIELFLFSVKLTQINERY